MPDKPDDKVADAKPAPNAPAGPAPVAAGTLPPGATVVATTAPQPHYPPTPKEAPPGGKFGVREVDTDDDGRRVEKVRYVNAHGLPFTDDPDENLRQKASERRDLRDRK